MGTLNFLDKRILQIADNGANDNELHSSITEEILEQTRPRRKTRMRYISQINKDYIKVTSYKELK